ncbi:YmfQ family protein [Trabulsiella odontotermitis]|uniref:YmfQ family protein n=1 Tax=Trabulsiella odontotermitis TaxID=379893 RepID=UPI000675D8ED|nr:putative phage tail protein [Trabulsiella odontotermitis]KNC92536.1 phage tail protein [Trabulsiella odontotermitis]
MNTLNLLRALLPPVSYDPNGKYLSAELQAEANLFDEVKASAARALGSVTPFYATVTLSDWERIYEITPREGATQQERLQKVLFRMAQTGGLSIPYFINLAAVLGYKITITEPRSFQAGISRSGERLYIDDVRWVWQVNIIGSETPRYRFRAGASAAGDPLLTYGEPLVEAAFVDLKPAYTYCYFTYEDDDE